MEFVDYYQILGVSESADAAEIKRAYRKLARKYHPDVSQEENCAERFKEVGEAYQVLKDRERRAEYDELRHHRGSVGSSYEPPPGWQSSADFEDVTFTDQQNFSDFFEHLFGQRARQHARYSTESHVDARGQDMHSELSISLPDAFNGANVTLQIMKPVMHADGSIHNEHSTLQVKIPSGVINNQKIRLRGQGGPSIGAGEPGDLYVHLHIKKHDHFHLEGKDVSLSVPIAPWEAALGANIEVRTLSGPVSVTVPENSQNGQRLRLKGRGLPGNPAGDQYVVLSIVFPKATNDKQKALYKSMSDLWSFNPRKASGET